MNQSERIKYLTDLQGSEQEKIGKYRLLFKGKHQDFPIYRVKIDSVLYRLKNGRTVAKQEEYIIKHSKDKDFFEREESVEAQKAQDNILSEMIKEAGLERNLKESKLQKEPIIISYKGIVINGNRRVCAIKKSSVTFRQYVDCIILPRATTEEEINDLENSLQITKDNKAPYDWISEAKRISTYVHRKNTFKNIAEKLEKEEEEVKRVYQMYLHAEKYLQFIKKEKQWSFAIKQVQMFKDLVNNLNSKKNKIEIKDKDFFKSVIFHNIHASASGRGRKYEKIREIRNLLPKIKKSIDNLDLENYSEQNSEKIISVVYRIVEEEEEEKKDMGSLQYLEEALSKIQKSKEKINHKVCREELDSRLSKIERLIIKFRKYLDQQAIK